MRSNWKSWLLAAAGLGIGMAGCVTEEGRTGPALWSSVKKSSETATDVRLHNPSKLSLYSGKLAEKSGHRDKARKYYKAVLEKKPKDAEAIAGLARLELYDGNLAKARQGIQQAFQLDPNNAEIQHSMGLLHAAQHQYQHALPYFNKAVVLNPREKNYHYQLAVALARVGDFNTAMPHFRAAVGEAEAHYNVGYILMEQGRTGAAARQFQIALKKDPNLRPAQEMLSRLQQAAPAVQPQSRQPVQSVSHTTVRNFEPTSDLGSQSAWDGKPSTTPINSGTYRGTPHSHPLQRQQYMTPQQMEQWRNQQSLPPR